MPSAAASLAASRAVSAQASGSNSADFRQGRGKERAVAMDDVEADEQRNTQAGFLDCDTLHFAGGGRPDKIEQIADPAGADIVGGVAGDHRSGHGVAGGHHGELTELLGQGHPADERLDGCRVSLRFHDEYDDRSPQTTAATAIRRRPRPSTRASCRSSA